MTSSGERAWLHRLHRWLLSDRRAQLAIAIGSFVVLLVLAVTRRYLDTEGVFTYDLAATLGRGYFDSLMAIQAKPPLQILYAPFAALGYDAFLVMHAALAAAGVWLAAETARRWRLEAPNAAAWMLATSLGYAMAGSNGYANSDGAFFSALFLFLYAAGFRLPAALVLGLMPFVRHETAVLAAGFFAWDLWRRRDLRFVALALAFPGLYFIAGAIYHESLIWPFTHFPNPPNIPAAIRGFTPPTVLGVGEFLAQSLVVNFGVLGLLAPFAVRASDRRITLLLVISGVAIFALAFNQLTGASGIDRSLRFHVALLPPIAVLAAHALGRRSAWVGAAVVVVVLAMVPATRTWVLLAVAAAVALGLLRSRGDGVVVARILLVGSAVLLFVIGIATHESGEHQLNHRVVAALEASGIYHGQPVYSDRHIARHDRCADVGEATFLVNEAIRWYIDHHMASAHDRFDAMVVAFEEQGMLIDPDRHEVRTDAVYVFRDDERMRRWRDRVEAANPSVVELVDGFNAYFWPASVSRSPQ